MHERKHHHVIGDPVAGVLEILEVGANYVRARCLRDRSNVYDSVSPLDLQLPAVPSWVISKSSRE